jgi:hypothetical protein
MFHGWSVQPSEEHFVNRTERFTILLTPKERELIDRLAAKLERRPSDAVRRIIHFASRILDNDDESEAPYEEQLVNRS